MDFNEIISNSYTVWSVAGKVITEKVNVINLNTVWIRNFLTVNNYWYK